MLEQRTEFSWSTLKRLLAVSSAAYHCANAIELKDFVLTFLPAHDPLIVEPLSRLVSLVGSPELLGLLLARVEEARSAALTKIGSEIDLFCLEVQWGSARDEAVPQTWATRHMEAHPAISPEFDVFISHASEDKAVFVAPLADYLVQQGLQVWYDAFTLKLGDRLRQSIDRGLARSRYGIVVLSQAFFEKHWPQDELDGLAALEVSGRKVILPIWHGVSREEIVRVSPSLAERVAVSSALPLETVAAKILEAIQR